MSIFQENWRVCRQPGLPTSTRRRLGRPNLLNLRNRVNACSGEESVLAWPVVGGLLLGASGQFVLLEGSETASVGTVLLLSQVNGRVPLLLELIACSRSSLLAEDGENLGDVLSDELEHGELDLGLR